MNKEIEEKLLENSKGATYMSFILDVEIVIKKEGTGRINLAESKVRADRIPHKKEDFSKGSKKSNSLGKQSEVHVYSMLSEPMSMMNQRTRVLEEEQDISLSENQDSDKKSHSSENENIKKNKRSENEIIDKNTREEAEESEAITPAEKLIQKKKKRKEDRKARVFKGKVEKIDFLECNRIFMCNYLKIPKYSISSKVIRSYGRSFSSLVTSKKTPKEAVSSTSDSWTNSLGKKNSLACSKRCKIWKANFSPNKLNNLSASDKLLEYEFSTGDCGKRAQVENGKSVKNKNGNDVHLKQPQNMNHQQAIQFNLPVIAVESCFTSDIPTPLPFKQSISKNHSTRTFIRDIKSKNKPIKKSESWPVIHNNQIKSTILLCPKHMQTCKESLLATIPKRLINKKSNMKKCKGLSSLEIKFFNNTEKSINPQVSVVNGITQYMHISQNYTCKKAVSEHLVEVKPESVVSCGSRISKTFTRPLDRESKPSIKLEQETLKSLEAQNNSQLTKGKPKRNILQFFYKLVT